MPEVKVKTNENFSSFSVKIRNSSKLTPPEKLILFIIYSYKNDHINTDISEILISDTSLPTPEINKSLYCLKKRGWLQIKDNNYLIKQPQEVEEGQKIARTWVQIFGSLQLTPYSFEKILTYIDDGLEEELIIEVLKISAENAKGNPLNYCSTILSSLLAKEICTLEDYYEYNVERGEKFGKQISGGAKKSKKRMEKQTLAELYKKGYQ